MYGYMGKLLFVDLTKKKVLKRDLRKDFAKKYLGGNGFGAYHLFKMTNSNTNPLSPENLFCCTVGPVNGTLVYGAGRTGIVTKSPITNLYMDSYFGGNFGSEVKYAGYDSIFVTGRSDKPVFIVIDSEDVEIRDAEDIWGRKSLEAQEMIREELGKPFKTLCIGPGGENLVRFACTIGETRAAGRGGTGAVMGSKNLKAIAVYGEKDVEIYDMEGFMEFYDEKMPEFEEKLSALKDIGTPYLVNVINAHGALGTKNWQEEVFERAECISGEVLKEKFFVKHTACHGCRVGCGKIFKAKNIVAEGPEYETLYSLGSCCGIDSLEAIIEADILCDEYSLDTISMGVSVAFLMECYERGLITEKETDGIEFKFGNPEALLYAIKATAYRKGIGNLLAEGTQRMAEKIGKGSKDFAINVKGLEIAGHSPRALKSMAVGYSTASRGGSHHDSRPTYEYGQDKKTFEGKAKIAVDSSNWTVVGDSMIMCHLFERVLGFFLTENYVKLINFVTGFNFNLEDVKRIGERIYNLERCYNVRCGVTREKDRLPKRLLEEEIPKGPLKGHKISKEKLSKLLDEYYKIRGWDKNGIPRKEKLKELGLEWV